MQLATFLWPCVVFQHIVTCHGNTLLPQFLGMYRVTVVNEDTYLLVMRNVFSHRLHVHRKYDLKVNPVWIKQEWLLGVGRTNDIMLSSALLLINQSKAWENCDFMKIILAWRVSNSEIVFFCAPFFSSGVPGVSWSKLEREGELNKIFYPPNSC